MPDFSALHSLSDGLQKKLGELVVVAIWGGCGYLLKLGYDALRALQASRRKAKQSQPAFLAEKAIALNVAADRVCQWAGADHASIYLLSNGQFAANGDSIQRVSMVGEGTQMPSQRRWMPESQNLATSLFPRLMLALDQGNVWLYQDEADDYQVNHYLRTRGYASRLVLPLHGAKKALIGLLCLGWNEGRFTDEALPGLADLENHRRAAAAILAST